MTLQRQLGFWLAALAVFALFLWAFSPILLPFVAGFVLAYFLDPVADALERLGLSRVIATALILLVALAFIVAVFVLVVPVLADQIGKLAAEMPTLAKALGDRFNEWAPQWLKDMVALPNGDATGTVTDVAGGAATWVASLLKSLWTGSMALFNVISLLVITPIVAFYLLADWDHMVAKVDSWLPLDHADEVRAIARDINTAMAGFIRGQGTVCLLLGTFYAIALWAAGLKFGLAIGLGAGLLSFVPYVGAIIGGLTAIGVALVQFWPDYAVILMVAGIFAAGQFIEGNFLSPKLVGESIGLHPVWLMFALLAFGYVFGFAGLLLAVPLAAAMGVFVRYALARYLGSRLYTGISRTVPEPEAVVVAEAAPPPAPVRPMARPRARARLRAKARK
jgi:predicted PurR-regulated permease PerM